MLLQKAVIVAKDYSAKERVGLFVSGNFPTINNKISM
jgi:hypothetical protein